jgi:two-component system sensor histidine kinase YesM
MPYRETTKIMHLFAAGYTIQDAFKIRCPISYEFEAVMNRVQEMFSTQELINASKRQAQYLALQNQINPHFLYNTLEGIRGEAISANMTNIAEMTEALSTFFRYTISNVENLVSLEDELRNVGNYFLIQQYRFGDRLQLKIDCDNEDRQEIYKCRLPKLTLQPIVENAIIHGVEQKTGEGVVRIRIETTAKRLLITISDNGVGMSPEQLMRLNSRLNLLSFQFDSEKNEKREGIAMVNVNNRIRLLFGEEYGITIYSTQGIGTDVVITLPYHLEDMHSLPENVEDGKRAQA